MDCQSENCITVYDRLAFLERIMDGLQPARELSFADLYQRWTAADFFKQLQQLGHITVSYNGSAAIDFVPSTENANRHQALALSTFLASRYADSDSVVESPQEIDGIFKATFTREEANTVHYVNEYGTSVRFFFDASRPCQI